MSTKVTIYYDNNIHIYQECADYENLYIAFDNSPSCKLVLMQVAGLLKQADYNELKRQSEISDEIIKEFVTNCVHNRFGKEGLDGLPGLLVFGDAKDPINQQIAEGIKYYTEIRDRLRKLVHTLEGKRTGSQYTFGLEGIY